MPASRHPNLKVEPGVKAEDVHRELFFGVAACQTIDSKPGEVGRHQRRCRDEVVAAQRLGLSDVEEDSPGKSHDIDHTYSVTAPRADGRADAAAFARLITADPDPKRNILGF